MLSFVSTFPPAMCGIGTYTKYVTTHMPEGAWEVVAFQLDEFSVCSGESTRTDPHVDYWICLENPSLPPSLSSDVLWFQHSFGMWGRVDAHFLKLIEEGRRRGKKVGASFHTIHFQSKETPWGVQKKEWELLRDVLPLLDFATVFTQGAHRAVVRAFPHHSDKVVVLRHGVHHYPGVSKDLGRKRLFDYLTQLGCVPAAEKAELRRIEKYLASGNAVLLGNYGFITKDKDPLSLYEVGRLVQEKLPDRQVITLFVGKIQERKDRKREVYVPILERLKAIHDGKVNLFYEDYLPERVFPYAFGALDFALFWCENATQSGRMAHAQGTGVAIAGRRWEGIGETLELSGLPAADTMEELAQRISEIVREPGLQEQMQEQSRRYADQYSFSNQARKHLILGEAVRKGEKLPVLDGEVRDGSYPGELSSWRFRRPEVPRQRIEIGP